MEGYSCAHNEQELSAALQRELSKRGAAKIAEEWEVVPGQSQYGKGDLVFRMPDGSDMVVELKYINLDDTGPAAQARRRKQRREVEEQALYYGDRWRQRSDAADVVHAASYTNERVLRVHKTWHRNK